VCLSVSLNDIVRVIEIEEEEESPIVCIVRIVVYIHLAMQGYGVSL
jgi:hypothetical protein